jgi:octaprenyl-diphosphate synthase
LQDGKIEDGDLDQAMTYMREHNALSDTMERARHYGAIARDAMAIFPDSDAKSALLEAIEFCVDRPY